MYGYHNTSHSRPGQARQPQLRRLRCSGPVGSTGAAVLYRHTQQDTSINSRHEVDRLGAAGSASNESRSIDHLQVMNSLVGAQWRRRTHECSRTGRGPCASQPPMQQWHAGGSWPCHSHGFGRGSRRDGAASLHPRPSILYFHPLPVHISVAATKQAAHRLPELARSSDPPPPLLLLVL